MGPVERADGPERLPPGPCIRGVDGRTALVVGSARSVLALGYVGGMVAVRVTASRTRSEDGSRRFEWATTDGNVDSAPGLEPTSIRPRRSDASA